MKELTPEEVEFLIGAVLTWGVLGMLFLCISEAARPEGGYIQWLVKKIRRTS